MFVVRLLECQVRVIRKFLMYAMNSIRIWRMIQCTSSSESTKVHGTITGNESISVGLKKIGVILVNTGTPSGYSYWPIRRYLWEFLSDQRVIELPRIFWWPVLHLLVLIRPFNIGKSYRNRKKQKGTGSAEDRVFVKRHGSLDKESRHRCNKLVIVPLFPQFSAVTNASVFDETCRCLMKQRHQMALSVVPAFYDNKMYVEAIVKHLGAALRKFRTAPEVVIVSYHGIPLSYQINGDPYGFQCKHTTALIRQSMPTFNCDLLTTFQSRLGPAEWLKPYTDETVIQLAKSGVKRIMVIAPGFFSDCLETTEELGSELADNYRKYGGEEFVYVPCLNDSTEAIDLLESLSRKHIQCFL
uniref:Ferrochelatase n=1 Tax=Setaria digitata TaxID=48799 RepID=A0A915PTJ9_9BILA